MVNSRTEYSEQATEAARMVLLELVRILGEYRDAFERVNDLLTRLDFVPGN